MMEITWANLHVDIGTKGFNAKLCWPAILINNHIWERSLGICSWLDLVILQYFC